MFDICHISLTAPAPLRKRILKDENLKKQSISAQGTCRTVKVGTEGRNAPMVYFGDELSWWKDVQELTGALGWICCWGRFLMNFTVLSAVNAMTASVHLFLASALNNLRYWNSQRATVSIQCYHSCVMSAGTFNAEDILLFHCSNN